MNRLSYRASIVLTVLGITAGNEFKMEPNPTRPESSDERAARAQPRNVEIIVDAGAFSPNTVEAKAGQPLTMASKRVTEEGRAKVSIFSELKIRGPGRSPGIALAGWARFMEVWWLLGSCRFSRPKTWQ